MMWSLAGQVGYKCWWVCFIRIFGLFLLCLRFLSILFFIWDFSCFLLNFSQVFYGPESVTHPDTVKHHAFRSQTFPLTYVRSVHPFNPQRSLLFIHIAVSTTAVLNTTLSNITPSPHCHPHAMHDSLRPLSCVLFWQRPETICLDRRRLRSSDGACVYIVRFSNTSPSQLSMVIPGKSGLAINFRTRGEVTPF